MPCKNLMSSTRNSSRRMLNASFTPPFSSHGITLNNPSYSCNPIARHVSSTIPICPFSAGRPILSRTSPNASVFNSSFASSYDSTVNPYLSVVRYNRAFPSPDPVWHSDIVAIRPFIGTSSTGFSPSACKRYTSSRVLFATIKSVASLDVNFPTAECVTTVGLCACGNHASSSSSSVDRSSSRRASRSRSFARSSTIERRVASRRTRARAP